ncbi:MAG: hypothetical protein J3Q66DRAFT_68323 [Benniella sp.]|nr:MAG: hypothetical protein J3Q66DRAFT_68323 [Benniella sp.]
MCRDWLVHFSRSRPVRRATLLIVDQVMWDMIHDPADSDERHNLVYVDRRFEHVLVIRVPKGHASFLPIAAGMVKEFKGNYLRFSLTACPGCGACRQDQGRLANLGSIDSAWIDVERPTIQRSFKAMVELINERRRVHGVLPLQAPFEHNEKARHIRTPYLVKPFPQPSSIDPEEWFQRALKNAYRGVPDTVLQYFQTQDYDIGPSSFLRTRIREMLHEGNLEECFGSSYFGQLRYYNESDLICTRSIPSHFVCCDGP